MRNDDPSRVGVFFRRRRESALLVFDMDRSDGYNDLEWAIGLNRCMLKIIGLWPLDSNDTREHISSKFRRLLNIILLIFVLTIPALISLIRVWDDMLLVIDNLQFTLPLLITILKVSIMWGKKEALMLLINMIAKDWIKTKIEKERNVMLRQARISRVLAMCGGLMILSTLIFGMIFPLCFGWTIRYVTNLTDPGKPLIIQTYYIYDMAKSPQFELTLIVQGIGLILSGLTYTGVDTFLGLLVLHICGQMENLHIRLANLEKDTNYKAILKYNVKDHVRLIRSIQIIDNTFHLMLLGLFFLFGILFCLHGFLIINTVHRGGHLSFIQLVSYLAASVCVLLHTCLYCAVGEFLVTQSEMVHRATYESVWYTYEPQLAKELTLIMLRANKPLYITAGKTFPLTMASFCNLLKTSAGYISVLLANLD